MLAGFFIFKKGVTFKVWLHSGINRISFDARKTRGRPFDFFGRLSFFSRK
jgi:hypothetical protein